MGEARVTRSQDAATKLHVVPAKAGTHTPRRLFGHRGADVFRINQVRWLWVPAFAGTTKDTLIERKIRDLQRLQHCLRDIRRAITPTELHRLDAIGIDLVDRALDALAGFR